MSALLRRHRAAPVLGVVIAGAVVGLQALLVPLFAAPAAQIAPRDLPVVVTAPGPAGAALADRLRAQRPGAFDVTVVPDAAAADRALTNRTAYGAFVVGAHRAELHVASAASPTVAALLTQAAADLNSGGPPPAVVDVVPADPDDPRGAGFAAGFLPLALVGLLAGALLAIAARGRAARLTGLATFAALAGLVGAAVLQGWLGVLPGSYWLNAAVLGLFALAVSGTVAGLGALLGHPGVGLGALVVFIIGNPLSAVAAAPELLPQPWGTVGQYLPVGAGATLLRDVAYFEGAGGARAAWVLTAYAVVGLALVAAERPRTATNPAAVAPANRTPVAVA